MIPRMMHTFSNLGNSDPPAPCRAATVGFVALGGLILLALTLAGCTGARETAAKRSDEYSAPLPLGEIALREVRDPATFRRLLEKSYDPDDALLLEAGLLSGQWFARPSASSHYPVAGIDFELARNSLQAMLDLLERRLPRAQFVEEVMRRFALYESVGWDGRGTVLFTGYYAPEFPARREPTGAFQYPLYRRPADLATDPVTGRPLGRWIGEQIRPYPTRREIEQDGLLAGTELVWLASPLDVYLVHVNGSARLRLPGGELMHVGYAGKTDRPYTGLGQTMLRRRLIAPDELSLPGIRSYFESHPDELLDLLYENESYVFFTSYQVGDWPTGSLGVRVTERRSLATDKAIFPRGGIVLVDTRIPAYAVGETRPFIRMMLDQDTGGAIKAPGRADIFMGHGKLAESLAGRQYQEGKLYYVWLRPSRTDR